MTIGYLGPADSFTYSATKFMFPSETLIPFQTIVTCLKGVELEQVDYVVVPIENSIEGTVNQTLDYLYHYATLPIQAEIILPINQNLMVHPNWEQSWKSVKKVKSHPQALAQTQQFISEYLSNTKQEITNSTTEAAEWLKNNPNECVGAIASKEAAERYGLSIVKSNIQDIPNNQTRFWVIGKNQLRHKKSNAQIQRKTIAVEMKKNKPGNLHKILSTLSWREIDLTKIESRPLKTKLGDYFFLLDIKCEDLLLINLALDEMTTLGAKIKDLGCYPVYSKK